MKKAPKSNARLFNCRTMASSLGDIFKFKVPIPSTLLENVTSAPPRPHCELSSHSLRSGASNHNYPTSAVNSIWGGSNASRNDRRFLDNGSRPEMPPPQAPKLLRRPYNHMLNDESVLPTYNLANKFMHSTPLHAGHGVEKSQSLFRPMADSTLSVSNWSGIGSTYRGCESVQSLASNNTGFIDTLLQRGLNKFLAKGRFNPDYEDMVSLFYF